MHCLLLLNGLQASFVCGKVNLDRFSAQGMEVAWVFSPNFACARSKRAG